MVMMMRMRTEIPTHVQIYGYRNGHDSNKHTNINSHNDSGWTLMPDAAACCRQTTTTNHIHETILSFPSNKIRLMMQTHGMKVLYMLEIE
jgi:hypothetical protein